MREKCKVLCLMCQMRTKKEEEIPRGLKTVVVGCGAECGGVGAEGAEGAVEAFWEVKPQAVWIRRTCFAC